MPTRKPKKAGRPPLPKGDARAVMLRIRVTMHALQAFKETAKASNKTVSEWIRSTLEAAINA